MAQLEIVIDIFLQHRKLAFRKVTDRPVDRLGARFKVNMVVQFSMVGWEGELVRRGLGKYIIEIMVYVGESTRVNQVAVDMEEINLILWINVELINKADFDVLV